MHGLDEAHVSIMYKFKKSCKLMFKAISEILLGADAEGQLCNDGSRRGLTPPFDAR